MRAQTGLIPAFLGTQLADVLELQGDHWVPAATGAQALVFDPAFLRAINTLQRLAAHLLAEGEPQYRFEFKPIPTLGLTDTLLTLDGQKLHYYNQRETWQAMTWPANNLQEAGTRLQWQTPSGRGPTRTMNLAGARDWCGCWNGRTSSR
ncbi:MULTISPECIES: type VI secretion IcmF C-terminal domain-containing protein [Cupriavidus]|uniref:type VI secretion IcmF C-terminal domain-containing protein n=1 Tax=Cupriavidus TaxID=106589 RepID=UPI002E26C945